MLEQVPPTMERCAVGMEALRIIQALGLKPRRTIRIALWSGEEQGLLGSRAYVAEHLGKIETPPTGGAGNGNGAASPIPTPMLVKNLSMKSSADISTSITVRARSAASICRAMREFARFSGSG